MNFTDCTLLMMTCERSDFLSRAMRYWSSINIKVIVADGDGDEAYMDEADVLVTVTPINHLPQINPLSYSIDGNTRVKIMKLINYIKNKTILCITHEKEILEYMD